MAKEKCECDGGSCCGRPWLIVLVVLVAAVLLVGAFMAGTIYTKDQSIIVSSNGDNLNQKLLSVSGSVTKYVTPDKVDITLSVETLDRSAQKSQSDNSTTSNAVRQALSAAGVAASDIKTVSYSENEEFQWNDLTKKSESTGYRTINEIQVTLTDTTMAGKVVDAAVQAGANSVSGISFGLTDAKELSIREQALQEASQTAKAKAQSIASGLGVSVGKVHSISESSFYYTPNVKTFDMTNAASGASAPTPVTPGNVEVDASVSVNFEIS